MKHLFYYVFATLIMLHLGIQSTSAIDIVLKSKAEVIAYIENPDSPSEVDNFTIDAPDLDRATFNSIPNKLLKVNGTFSMINLTHYKDTPSFNDPETINGLMPFFGAVELKGGLVFKNCPYIAFPGNAFKNDVNMLTVINGDLIIENCKNFPHPATADWKPEDSYGIVEEITGDYIIRGSGKNFTNRSLQSLRRVGGDFIIANPQLKQNNMNRLGCFNLTEIGGDLIIDGMSTNLETGEPNTDIICSFKSLTCFQSLEKVGGDVKILNCPFITDYGNTSDDQDNYGYCFIRYLIDEGIIDYANHDVQLGASDDLKDLALLGGCFDGGFQDPSDYEIIDLPDKTTALHIYKNDLDAQAIILDNTLIINTSVNIAKAEIFDTNGCMLMRYSDIAKGNTSFDVSTLTRNIYIVRLTTTDNLVKGCKVIKK